MSDDRIQLLVDKPVRFPKLRCDQCGVVLIPHYSPSDDQDTMLQKLRYTALENGWTGHMNEVSTDDRCPSCQPSQKLDWS